MLFMSKIFANHFNECTLVVEVMVQVVPQCLPQPPVPAVNALSWNLNILYQN